tara:strand:+ start:771 stop:1058 length:288 start_codon:yes stop_codon:yes gene_type:complete
MIEKGEIVLCDIIIKGKKIYKFENVIFSRFYDCEFPKLNKKEYSFFFNKHKIKDKIVFVQSIDVKVKTGFKHKNINYTEVKKNNQKRNTKSGKYD